MAKGIKEAIKGQEAYQKNLSDGMENLSRSTYVPADAQLRKNLEGLQQLGGYMLTNPTGQKIRVDSKGDGRWGASRDGGTRRHEGIDLSAAEGQPIFCPIDGRVRNFGKDEASVPMLIIYPTIPNPHYDRVEILYVDAPEGVKPKEYRDIAAGEPIGVAANLQDLGYSKGVGAHVHIQLKKNGIKIDPTPFFKEILSKSKK